MFVERHKKEIKRIIKEILKKSRPYTETLYFKMKYRKLEAVGTYVPKFLKEEEYYNGMSNLLLNPELAYALQVNYWYMMKPSFRCISFHDYYNAIIQFTQVGHNDDPNKIYNIYAPFVRGFIYNLVTSDKDPLSQIFMHKSILLDQLPQFPQFQHVYFCPYIYTVEASHPDPTSIFHQKDGIIAYCFTIRDFIPMVKHRHIVHVYSGLKEIYDKAYRKLQHNKELDELWQKDPAKACDINLIKSIIHDEIEEAEKLMRQYNIIRVAFPLD